MAESKLTSVIIPWKDRPEIRECLVANARYFSSDQCEVIVVNCGGDNELLDNLLDGLPLNVMPVYLQHQAFNKCLAQNIGAAVAIGGMLLLLDADVVLEDDLPRLAYDGIGSSEFYTVASVRESGLQKLIGGQTEVEIAHQLAITIPGRTEIQLETNRTRPLAGIRSGPGLVAVHRQHFLEIGGANSSLHGWGWEDLDLIVRLQVELGLTRVQVGSVLHLSHPDTARVLYGRSRAECEQENFLTCLSNYMAGHFRGTFEQDIATRGVPITKNINGIT